MTLYGVTTITAFAFAIASFTVPPLTMFGGSIEHSAEELVVQQWTSRTVEAAAKQLGAQVVTQYGNANLQTAWGAVQDSFNGLAGHDVATVSAHQALRTINVVLLVLAGIAILLALNVLVWIVRPDWESRLGALVVSILVAPVLHVMVVRRS